MSLLARGKVDTARPVTPVQPGFCPGIKHGWQDNTDETNQAETGKQKAEIRVDGARKYP
jgi:hypothetical protein